LLSPPFLLLPNYPTPLNFLYCRASPPSTRSFSFPVLRVLTLGEGPPFLAGREAACPPRRSHPPIFLSFFSYPHRGRPQVFSFFPRRLLPFPLRSTSHWLDLFYIYFFFVIADPSSDHFIARCTWTPPFRSYFLHLVPLPNSLVFALSTTILELAPGVDVRLLLAYWFVQCVFRSSIGFPGILRCPPSSFCFREDGSSSDF